MSKNGKQFEQLVHLIERSITPDSIVKHDVNLPIIHSKIGATTQCDIVIRTGTSPRQTLTLIEVQDRGSKVKPNDFRGWKQKLEDVGGQHLICVSRQDFPASIKEQASLSGGSIMLVTLKKSEPENLPLDFVRLHYQFRNFDLKKLSLVRPTISKSEAESLGVRKELLNKTTINANEQCWSIDGEHLVSLYILCRDYYAIPEAQTSGTGAICFDREEGIPLYYFVNGVFIRAGLDCEFEWTNEVIEKPVSVLTYDQNEFGVLAWVAEIEHETPKGKLVFRMPLIKSGNNYIVNSLYTELPQDTEFTFGVMRGGNNA